MADELTEVDFGGHKVMVPKGGYYEAGQLALTIWVCQFDQTAIYLIQRHSYPLTPVLLSYHGSKEEATINFGQNC